MHGLKLAVTINLHINTYGVFVQELQRSLIELNRFRFSGTPDEASMRCIYTAALRLGQTLFCFQKTQQLFSDVTLVVCLFICLFPCVSWLSYWLCT